MSLISGAKSTDDDDEQELFYFYHYIEYFILFKNLVFDLLHQK